MMWLDFLKEKKKKLTQASLNPSWVTGVFLGDDQLCASQHSLHHQANTHLGCQTSTTPQLHIFAHHPPPY